MDRIFFIDSENIGDLWVNLLAGSEDNEEIIVFYTNKSPHMSYDNLRILKESPKIISFVKVCGGNNALDFQLVTELGYRLCNNSDAEFIIVTNDTGFDAVVRYWKSRDKNVIRITGNDCKNFIRTMTDTALAEALVELEAPAKPRQLEAAKVKLIDKQKQVNKKVIKLGKAEEKREPIILGKLDDEQEPDKAASEEAMAVKGAFQTENKSDSVVTAYDEEQALIGDVQPQTPEKVKSDKEYALELLYCVGLERVPEWHNALVQIFGDKKGKELFAKIKSEKNKEDYILKHEALDKKQRFELYCSIIFEKCAASDKVPEGFSEYLYSISDKRKNLNSLRADLQARYGKEDGMKYYSIVKLHIKTLNKI